jgi:hypothetical protein
MSSSVNASNDSIADSRTRSRSERRSAPAIIQFWDSHVEKSRNFRCWWLKPKNTFASAAHSHAAAAAAFASGGSCAEAAIVPAA